MVKYRQIRKQKHVRIFEDKIKDYGDFHIQIVLHMVYEKFIHLTVV